MKETIQEEKKKKKQSTKKIKDLDLGLNPNYIKNYIKYK